LLFLFASARVNISSLTGHRETTPTQQSSIDGGVAMFDALLRDDHEHRLSLDAVHRMRHVRTSCTTIPEEDAVSDRSLQIHLSTLAREREQELELERQREREVSWKVGKVSNFRKTVGNH